MRRRTRLLALATLILAACGGTEPVLPPETVVSPTPTPSPTPSGPPEPTPSVSGGPSLLERARADGSVPVIVDLAGDWRPEAELSPEARDAQRDAIARAQDELLGALADHETTVVARYDVLPQIALEVDEAGLLVLLRSPLVRTVHLNELDRANG